MTGVIVEENIVLPGVELNKQTIDAVQPLDRQYNPIGVLRPMGSLTFETEGLDYEIELGGVYRVCVKAGGDEDVYPFITFSDVDENEGDIYFTAGTIEYLYFTAGTKLYFNNGVFYLTLMQ